MFRTPSPNRWGHAKVYIAMWQCQSCQYQNEDWDETCSRCTAPKGASSVVAGSEPTLVSPAPAASSALPSAAAAQPPAGSAVPGAPEDYATVVIATPLSSPLPPQLSTVRTPLPEPPPAPSPLRKRSRMDAAVTAIIIVCVFGLVFVGWLAYQRGMFDKLLQGATGGPVGQTAGEGVQGASSDPLDMLNDRHVPHLDKFKDYAEVLRRTDTALAGHTVSAGGTSGTLSDDTVQWLDQLHTASEELSSSYDSFETEAAKYHEGELEKYKVMLREQFARRMSDILEPVAQARALDLNGNLAAYMISDLFFSSLEKWKQVDSAPLHDRWLKALHDKDQLALDIKNADVYKQLEARISALTDMHNDFQATLSSAPEYKVRNGYIDKTAEHLLDAYDLLAAKIEQFAEEFEDYTSKLDPALDSDRRKELIAQFMKLAQDDHEYAFSETYKLYSKDRELTHPAYQHLRDHLEWVKQHWPDREGAYRQIYTSGEAAWDLRFRNAGGSNGGGPGSGPPPDDGEAGADPSPPDDGGGSPPEDGGGVPPPISP